MRDVKIIKEGVIQYRVARMYGIVKAEPMPDEVIAWAGTVWDQGGYSSFIVFRVVERGIPWDMLDHAMRRLVGEDWIDLSCTNWIHHLEIKGIEDFAFGKECYGPQLYDDGADEPPLADVITDLVLKYEHGWWRE